MSEKRRRFGRVRQLPSGQWQARYPGPDGQLRSAPHTFAREKDADQWLSEVETDLRRGDWTDPDAGRIPLSQYAKAWIEERPGLAVRTKELYHGLLQNHPRSAHRSSDALGLVAGQGAEVAQGAAGRRRW